MLVAAAAAVAVTVGGSLAVLAASNGDSTRIPESTPASAVTAPTATLSASPTASPSGSPAATAPPATLVPAGQPRAGSQGSVVVPPGQRDLLLNVSFKGVTIGRVGDRFEVVYPQVYATRGRDGSQAVHVKLPLWSCARRVSSQQSLDFSGCRDRRVSYLDVVGGRDAVLARPDGSVQLTAAGYAYSYRGGRDRGPGLPATYTGRSFTVTAEVRPGPVQDEVEGLVERRATGVVQVDGKRAVQDDRYTNLIRLPR